jgi:hypothetical protein
MIRRLGWALACPVLFACFSVQSVGAICPDQRDKALKPADPARCVELAGAVRAPSALPLDRYQAVINEFLGGYCHRDESAGWRRDKFLRDTGPFTASLAGGDWSGTYHGTHAPVVIWYSPDMADWVITNRSGEGVDDATPPPDGAIMIKEMYTPPAAHCADVDPLHLYPKNGAAIMIRDGSASHDGWYWGWYGFGPDSGWAPDWPPAQSNPLSNQGFAQYCMNCHASAESHLTFASAKNVEGEPGRPLVFLSQHFFGDHPASATHHGNVTMPTDPIRRLGTPLQRADAGVVDSLKVPAERLASWENVDKMPSQTFDQTWVAAGGPTAGDQFVTSSQCLGCHDAGSTGLQFDMTEPAPDGKHLINLSPYATWRSSPMGLAGRDPVFFAQLASETQSFHPEKKELVTDTCLGCHGVLGQRQYHIDQFEETGECQPFTRELVNAVPYPDDNPHAGQANYGALARDGISCTSCHRMALGKERVAAAKDQPENACVEQRQDILNPDNQGFARTFTGSFWVGPPDELIGPFDDPRVKPMEHALGITPVAHESITNSEVCGSCHTVHLPIINDGDIIGYTYEQTTYPEWAFSGFRTGQTADGPLPHGAGDWAESCQGCHMPSRDAEGNPYRSKIASIQEFSNFPQAEFNLGPDEIDLPVRDGFARHTLVGLNVFLVMMAQQFPDVLGIRTIDPMLTSKGIDSLLRTEQAMLDLADNETAEVVVSDLKLDDTELTATVTVSNKAGHKFPSGVGFRRAFVSFEVFDDVGGLLWQSGRTNAAGALVGPNGETLDGELWWRSDCSERIRPYERVHQPHYQRIDDQRQVQIYQELVATPPPAGEPVVCGHEATPAGQLTTSFLSICTTVKDNRLLPEGFMPLNERKEIARAIGAGDDLAIDVEPVGVGDDPDYVKGGGDSLIYAVALSDLPGGARPAAVKATLYYQATPPFFLQDRLCTAQGPDSERLGFLISHLNLGGTRAEGWKLKVVSSGRVEI